MWQHHTQELKLFPLHESQTVPNYGGIPSEIPSETFGFEKWLLNEYSIWTFFIATKSFRNNSWKGIQTDQTVWSVN